MIAHFFTTLFAVFAHLAGSASHAVSHAVAHLHVLDSGTGSGNLSG